MLKPYYVRFIVNNYKNLQQLKALERFTLCWVRQCPFKHAIEVDILSINLIQFVMHFDSIQKNLDIHTSLKQKNIKNHYPLKTK